MSETRPAFPGSKARPSGWWFVVGVVLLLAGAASFGWFLYRSVDGFAEIEARVPADGAAHQVNIAPDREMFLWVQDDGGTECQVLDRGGTEAVTIHAVSGSYTRASWVAAGRFGSGTGRLTVTCTGGPAEIGPEVDVGAFVINLLLAIGLPLLLGGAGLAVIVVTGVLWAVRPARAR